MSTFPIQTTAPGAAATCDPENQAPCLALVLVWSASEPHRVGEIAFFPPFERLFVGRGDVEIEKFALFGRQRPGETFAPSEREGLLAGDTISRRQIIVRPKAVTLDIQQVGKCPTFVNGVECREASLKPGDTVMFRREAVFVCVRRPRMLPALEGWGTLHAYGEADADGIVGESAVIWWVRQQLALVAAGDEHVLIQGETGTGKELAAAAIHRRSQRALGPFIAHNASTFTLTLLESELFGNVLDYPNKGMPARKGLLASAHLGTLFLDEIGDCPLEAQSFLLRCLESGEIKPVGESIARRVDVRVVGATHRDDSFFRPDFRARFTRSIALPPLRERPEDIALLLRHLMIRRAERHPEIAKRFFRTGASGRVEPRINGRFVEYLVRQALPANVRELQAMMLKAIDASTGGEVRMPVVPIVSATAAVTAEPEALEEEGAEGEEAGGLPSKEMLVACLQREAGNVSRVAKRLEIHRNVVYRLMEKFGIKREDTGG